MGACEITPTTTHARGTSQPSPAHQPNPARLFLAPHDRPPLAGIQLVRPRRCAAAGAPAGHRPARRRKPAATRKATKQSSPQPGDREHSHQAMPVRPLDKEGPHGCVFGYLLGTVVRVRAGPGKEGVVWSTDRSGTAGAPAALPPGTESLPVRDCSGCSRGRARDGDVGAGGKRGDATAFLDRRGGPGGARRVGAGAGRGARPAAVVAIGARRAAGTAAGSTLVRPLTAETGP
jgi:hypothetical protein